jgi:hypothetical protein
MYKERDLSHLKSAQISYPGGPIVDYLTQYRRGIPSEEGGALVFSQGAAGELAVMLYLPSSVSVSSQYFLIGYWRDPGTVTSKNIRALLELWLQANVFCGTTITPNRKCGDLVEKLKLKESIIQKGVWPLLRGWAYWGSKLFRFLRPLVFNSAGAPTPPTH